VVYKAARERLGDARIHLDHRCTGVQ